MGEKTGIAWTDHTFNPWIGCTKITAGCDHCYAESENNRFQWNPNGWGKGKPRKLTSDANWKKPLQWARQAVKDGVTRRVFCASLADVFDAEVDEAWKLRLYDLIDECGKIGGLEWLLLTKRTEWIFANLPIAWQKNPPEFIRLGATAEHQVAADYRYPDLFAYWHGKNFLSVEPMLGPVNLKLYLKLDLGWVICGCESGENARPMNIDWARSLRDQCQAAGVPFFLKQMIVDGKLVKMPELDGVVWDQFPGVEK